MINYFLAASLGRFLVYKLTSHRFAKYLLINKENLTKAENYFLKNSNSATFFGRLIPVIRQLISIPAGFSRMPLGRFVFLTSLGSFIWVSVLGALGYFLGSNQETLNLYYRELSWGLIVFLVIYIFFKLKIYKVLKRKKN